MSGHSKHPLADAREGQSPENRGASGPSEELGKPQATHDQVAEETRRQQEVRSHGVPDRDQYLVNVGRGQQTHG